VSAGGLPTLSVIIPVWNGGRYLGEAIESVLTQDFVPLEVIVVDDGSEDDSAIVAESFAGRVRCLRRPHAGLASARNTGVEAARGECLLHLDADDLLTAGSIATRMAILEASSEVDLVVGFMASFVSPEIDAQTAARFQLPAAAQRGGLPGTSIVRSGFAARVGRFDSSLPGTADLDWMIRAQEAGVRLAVIPDVVLRRRIHGRNESLKPSISAGALRSLRAAMQRRRAGKEPGEP